MEITPEAKSFLERMEDPDWRGAGKHRPQGEDRYLAVQGNLVDVVRLNWFKRVLRGLGLYGNTQESRVWEALKWVDWNSVKGGARLERISESVFGHSLYQTRDEKVDLYRGELDEVAFYYNWMGEDLSKADSWDVLKKFLPALAQASIAQGGLTPEEATALWKIGWVLLDHEAGLKRVMDKYNKESSAEDQLRLDDVRSGVNALSDRIRKRLNGGERIPGVLLTAAQIGAL